ncbi:DUF1194 domain-containing protein [Mesorhizobium sp. M0977]|uniref:DUF1194 domain-containing protein n=1 Tax=Mesorhizobium sp. M0977 TaxID=2957039 RepID=UPI00333B040A
MVLEHSGGSSKTGSRYHKRNLDPPLGGFFISVAELGARGFAADAACNCRRSILPFDQPDGRAEMMSFIPRFAGRRKPERARGVLFAVAVSLTTSLSATAEQVSSVDLELVLCVDVSSSTSETEQRLQREGYVNALLDAEVLQSIRIRPAW